MDSKISFGDITIDKSSPLPCIQHENQNAAAYGYQENIKTSRLPIFLKVTKVQSLTLYAKMKFQTAVFFSKATRTTNAKMEMVCLGRRLLPMRNMFKFGRN